MIDAKKLEEAITLIHENESGTVCRIKALAIRQSVRSSMDAKRRYRYAYTAPGYEWKKPSPRR